MSAKDSNDIKAASQVVKDRPDLRDLDYLPTLARLRPELVPKKQLAKIVRSQVDPESGRLVGNCTAQALAALVDFLSAEDDSEAELYASANMLYFRGHEVEAAEHGRNIVLDEKELPEGLRSLRSALKGFYHNGVCDVSAWNMKGEKPGGADSIFVASAARNRTLGSYYRLKPILNDYHSALHEVGAIYVAAEIHEGWLSVKDGIIPLPTPRQESLGNHAFIVVGYTKDGFLVLNSWGNEWGGFKNSPEKDGLPGVALWRYQDWAERILDGWVLRLGVPAPEAFKFSFGAQGIADFVSGEIKYVSTPRHELIGHYIHIDDGELVTKGTLTSNQKSIQATCDMIVDRKKSGAAVGKRVYERVLLWIAGGNEPTKDAAIQVGITKEFWKSKGVYPITVIWCSDFIESALGMLDRAFKDALAKVGRIGPSLDARIESEVRGVGRAFWRDIKRSAEQAARRKTGKGRKMRPAGGMSVAFNELMRLKSELKTQNSNSDIELHIVAEGAGAILLARLLEQLFKGEDKHYESIASITLNLPACTVADFDKVYAAWIRRTNNKKQIDILVPNESAERRMRVGDYGGSLLQLVQMAFEEKPLERKRSGSGEPSLIDWRRGSSGDVLGLAKVAARVQRKYPNHVNLETLRGPPGDEPISSMRTVTMGQDAQTFAKKRLGLEQEPNEDQARPMQISQRLSAPETQLVVARPAGGKVF